MRIHELKPAPGAKRKRKRVGRGPGSGHGKTATRGHKGQSSRSGGGVGPFFEGGQMPLIRRLPKRGFVNIFRKEYSIVNLDKLNNFESGTVVDINLLKERGIIKRSAKLVKVLGDGDIKRGIIVRVNSFSRKAKEKIESAGGRAEVL